MKDIVYVRDLVEQLGSKSAAAAYLDCASSTMQKLYKNNAVFINGVLYIKSSSRAKLPVGNECILSEK